MESRVAGKSLTSLLQPVSRIAEPKSRVNRGLTATIVQLGNGTLQAAYAAASPGDELVLVNGGHAGLADNVLVIDKDIMICAQNLGWAATLVVVAALVAHARRMVAGVLARARDAAGGVRTARRSRATKLVVVILLGHPLAAQGTALVRQTTVHDVAGLVRALAGTDECPAVRTWIAQGTGDEVCPETFARQLAAGLEAAGVPLTAYFFEAGHSAKSDEMGAMLKRCVDEWKAGQKQD